MFESLASCFAFRCSASLNMTGNDLRLLRPLLAIDVTPMANRANRQSVIFVIEKIENPIITDSETKFLPAF
jgi:hypothetical protein